MNTFLLAAVAIALVAFLLFNRKRQKSAGAAPAKESSRAGSRGRGLKRGRGKKIDGYPEMSEAPATAVAETAASRTVAPVLEPLPPAEAVADPIVPVPSASAVADWGFDEMIVEPGWPLPGEMSAAGWPGEAAASAAPAASPVVAEPVTAEPVAVASTPADETPVDEASTGEWTMPSAEPYTAPEAPTAEPAPAVATGDEAPAMEAWVPGMTEVEPITLPESEPIEAAEIAFDDAFAPVDAPSEEPQLVWTESIPAEPVPTESIPTESTSTEFIPTEFIPTEAEAPVEADEVAGPPAWRPQTFEDATPEPVVEADPELPAWTPEPFVPVDAPVAEDVPWQPEAVAVGTVTIAEPEPEPEAEAVAETNAVAEGLARAVAALTPVAAADDARGVTPRMAAVLRVLAREPRALPDLARALDMSRAVVTDLVARLEELNLVRQEPDPDERRRRMIVVATLKGLWLARESVPSLDRDAVAGALGRLSPAERTALVAALRVLQEADPAR